MYVCDNVYVPYTRLKFQAFTPSTLPPTVPSSGGCGSPAVVVEVDVDVDVDVDVAWASARARSHSSGVWHLALQAWMAAISSRSAALTARCRRRLVWPAKVGDTTSEVKDWPQPPVSKNRGVVRQLEFSFGFSSLSVFVCVCVCFQIRYLQTEVLRLLLFLG